VCGYVEIEESARKIYEANFSKSECLGTDVCDISDEDIKSWQRKFGHISLLCGGPPCQGFSLAGKRDENDARNQLYRNYLNIAKILKPEVVVLENVRLLLSTKDVDGILISDKMIKMFDEIGYECKFEVLRAEEYGVPQARQRVIFIGMRRDLGIVPSHPAKTHSLEISKLKKPLTFRDACKDLSSLENGDSCSIDPLHWAIRHPEHVIEWLKATPEGKSAHDNEDPNLRPPSGYNTTYKRISWDEPASTVSTNFNMISGCRNVHPTNTRSYTIREALRCQSFPDDFRVVGKWDNVRKAIGNAVPPLLAKAIADHLMKKVFSQ
jgi:DNA (cytosine-5)-methyltransferase 1